VRYESEMLEYMHVNHEDLFEAIRSTGLLADETATRVSAALDEFAKVFQPKLGLVSGDEAAA
jgi:F-type H+-transporting ATPase subunit alpha